MPYINERWLGGMLTNFETISKRVDKMKEYERMRASGEFEAMPKKEALILGRELEKLERNLGGIRGMARRPDAVFVIDTKKEHIGVTEANKLGIPVVAVVDTNCDPDVIQYVIPGNDDAIRSGMLMSRIIADAVEEGRFIASRRNAGGRRWSRAPQRRGRGARRRPAGRGPPPGRRGPGRAGGPRRRPARRPGGRAGADEAEAEVPPRSSRRSTAPRSTAPRSSPPRSRPPRSRSEVDAPTWTPRLRPAPTTAAEVAVENLVENDATATTEIQES